MPRYGIGKFGILELFSNGCQGEKLYLTVMCQNNSRWSYSELGFDSLMEKTPNGCLRVFNLAAEYYSGYETRTSMFSLNMFIIGFLVEWDITDIVEVLTFGIE